MARGCTGSGSYISRDAARCFVPTDTHCRQNLLSPATMAKKELDHGLIEVARGLQNTPWCDEYERMISGMMSVPRPCPAGWHNNQLTPNGRPGTILCSPS